MDTLASLALATEPPNDEVLNRPPFPMNSAIVSKVIKPPTTLTKKKMTKHILGQAVYQIIVICFFLFAGDKFLPSGLKTNDSYPYALFKPGTKYADQSQTWRDLFTSAPEIMHHIANHNQETGLLRSGLELKGYDDLRYKSSVHYTYCFNVFVLMTFFNKFNARKLEDQLYILSGLFRS